MEEELGWLKSEMEKLADTLVELGDELDTEVVAAILRDLVNGATAQHIIADYALVDSGV